MYSKNVSRGLVACFIGIFSLLSVGSLGVSFGQETGEIRVSVASAVVDSDATGQGCKRFCELLGQKTKGRLKVQYFGSAQLGADREIIEQMKLGTVDCYVGSTAPETSFVPDMRMLDIPYIFDDREKAAKILDGELGNRLLSNWAPQGVKGLAWSDTGFRYMLTKKKGIRTPDDMVGLRMRIMEAPVYRALMEALGAIPIPVPWSELYSALQTNLVDGCEIPMNAIGTTKLYKIAPYISTTVHALATVNYLMNMRKFNSLPADIQNVVTESAREAGVYARQVVTQNDARWFKDIAADGGIIVEANVELFRNKTRNMSATIGNQINPELYKEIKKAQGRN